MLTKIGNAFFQVELIAVVRAVGKKQTNIFIAGQSAVDGGFLIDLPVEKVLDKIDQARYQQAAMDLARAGDEFDEADRINELIEEESADGTIEDNTINRLSDPTGPTVS